MLKKLKQRELKRFVDKFEIKCNSVELEKIQNHYFVVINKQIRLQVSYDSIREFIST